MARGLAWLPLLVLFFGLAWAGWNEYRKLEAYKLWIVPFERGKYDIYSALGQKGDKLTWGRPTRQGIVEVQTISISEVEKVVLEEDAQPVKPDEPIGKGKPSLGFTLEDGRHLSVPFTQAEMAQQWLDFLLTKVSS